MLLLALLRFSLIKFRVIICSARLICKAPKSAHITPLRSPLATNQQPDSIQNSSRLFRVKPFHTSLICFIPTLLLALFAQPQILGYSVFLGWEEEPWGRDFSVHRICGMELSSFTVSSLSSFKTKLKTNLFSSAY